MTNADRFIDKYKQLEEAVRFTYGLREEDSVTHYLLNKDKFRSYRDEFQYCKEVRNLLSHKKKIGGSFAVEPSEEMIEFLDNLIAKVKNRPRCYDIHIRLGEVYHQTLDARVRDTLVTMHKSSYRCVPILDPRGVVAGIFDLDSFLSYIATRGADSLNPELRFSDIADFISLDKKKEDKIIFVRDDSFADELEERIENALKKGVRTELAVVTANGSPKEKMLGIITPWEIIKM